MQTKFMSWSDATPMSSLRIVTQDSGQEFAVAIEKIPLPLEFSAEAGAIINAMRGALDILASSLARRNGKEPNPQRHFPIFCSAQQMVDPVTGIDSAERKKWLSEAERATIKSLKPYQGGDHTIWSIHELDILRKHERLLSATAQIRSMLILGNGSMRVIGESGLTRKRLDKKNFLYPLRPGETLSSAQGDTLPVIDIMLNESGLGVSDEEVVPALMRFGNRVAEIIKLFDT